MYNIGISLPTVCIHVYASFNWPSVRYSCTVFKHHFLDEHFEPPTSFSQVCKTEHRGLPCKRTTCLRFNEHQLSELKKKFKTHPYIKGLEKDMMAKNLGITQAAVTNWFCCERQKLKRRSVNEASNASVVTARYM